uniref:Transmembrane protein n=1 Tax=Meloidogyne floridensis TaxID=298350 RepID=A0A915NRZ5_9BILA
MSTKQQQQFSSSSSIKYSTQIFFYFRIIFIYYFLAIQKLDAYPNFYNNELPIQNFLSQGGEEKNEGENNGNFNNLKEENKLNDGNHPVFFGRKISSLGDLQQTFTELETPSSTFVRFFSPLQCSFYYKSNSNFANMLMRGDE